ncbi:unnamed protein product [Psylliodes chrysocephalus]|uniref:Tesmin/TSO1-like CXC domain-containing protein n=1 Tax=Psylliodes chrysocephalus TaxID=3402493 RepID=A0A9P0CTZ0_9CUCU|nr:unnamed protein product [Psylliodes chrysocephala]
MGKKTCWKVFLSHHNLLSNVDINDNLEEENFNKMRFYTNNENIHCINDLRGILASSKPISKLSPTLDSSKQYCLRVHYQTKIWLNSTIPRPSLPNVSECGWKIVNGKLVPILSTESILPEDTSALNTCNCKKECNGKQFSCKKKQICCIESCNCLAQITCANKVKKDLKNIKASQNTLSDSEENSECD